jgi:hypothetical protein
MAYSPFDLTGKTALITGGNSGIGLGMARAMAEAGANIAIWGTNEAKNAAAKAELEPTGRTILTYQCDVGDEAAVEKTFAETVAAQGPIHGCFANAGVSGRSGGKPFFEMPAEEWRRVMRVNLDGAFFTLRAASKHMVQNKIEGVLAGMASLAAIEASPRSEHYAATKGGMISMMKSLAVELARYGIRAHSIVPGWIDTGMTERTLASDGFQNKVLPRVPMRRWGTGDDFGGIAVYLMSSASRYHTGDTFVIDGGYSLF